MLLCCFDGEFPADSFEPCVAHAAEQSAEVTFIGNAEFHGFGVGGGRVLFDDGGVCIGAGAFTDLVE